ncbi:hypothetical protein JCM10207_006074 [Rhodosporidiobolus poonsookiae]
MHPHSSRSPSQSSSSLSLGPPSPDASHPASRPTLPIPRHPLDCLPRLLPWRLLVLLLRSADADIRSLLAHSERFEKLCLDGQTQMQMQPAWSAALEAWHGSIRRAAWLELRVDDLTDREALERLRSWLASAEAREGADVVTLLAAERDLGLLKERVLDRWFRLLALDGAREAFYAPYPDLPEEEVLQTHAYPDDELRRPDPALHDRVWPIVSPPLCIARAETLVRLHPSSAASYALPNPSPSSSSFDRDSLDALACAVFGHRPAGDFPPAFAPPAKPLPESMVRMLEAEIERRRGEDFRAADEAPVAGAAGRHGGAEERAASVRRR